MMEDALSLCSAKGSRVRTFGRDPKWCRADGTRLRAFGTKHLYQNSLAIAITIVIALIRVPAIAAVRNIGSVE